MSGHFFIPFDQHSFFVVFVVELVLFICELAFVFVFVCVSVFDHESGWRRECPSVRAPKSPNL